jgi:hypothetical protein
MWAVLDQADRCELQERLSHGRARHTEAFSQNSLFKPFPGLKRTGKDFLRECVAQLVGPVQGSNSVTAQPRIQFRLRRMIRAGKHDCRPEISGVHTDDQILRIRITLFLAKTRLPCCIGHPS